MTAYHVGARGEDVRARETRSLTAASVRPPDPCTRASQPPQPPLNYIFSATRRARHEARRKLDGPAWGELTSLAQVNPRTRKQGPTASAVSMNFLSDIGPSSASSGSSSSAGGHLLGHMTYL